MISRDKRIEIGGSSFQLQALSIRALFFIPSLFLNNVFSPGLFTLTNTSFSILPTTQTQARRQELQNWILALFWSKQHLRQSEGGGFGQGPGRRHHLQVIHTQGHFNQEPTDVLCGNRETLREEAVHDKNRSRRKRDRVAYGTETERA